MNKEFDPDVIWMLNFIENEGRKIEDALTLVKSIEDKEIDDLYIACLSELGIEPEETNKENKKQAIVACLINGYSPIY